MLYRRTMAILLIIAFLTLALGGTEPVQRQTTAGDRSPLSPDAVTVSNTSTTSPTTPPLHVRRHVSTRTTSPGDIVRITTVVSGASPEVAIESQYSPPVARGVISEVTVNGTGASTALRTATASGSVTALVNVNRHARVRVSALLVIPQPPANNYQITGSVTSQNDTVVIPRINITATAT